MLNYTKIKEYLKKHRQNSILHKILTGAAAVVVFVTTYALILPAITLETKPACGVEEHKHNELECYSNTGEFTCKIIEHAHTAECYPAEDIIAGISSNESMTGVPADGDSSDAILSNESSENSSENQEIADITQDTADTEDSVVDVSGNDMTEDVSDGDVSGGDVSGGNASDEIDDETFKLEKRYTDGKVIITAQYPETAEIPEEAQLVAYQVTAENAPGHYEQRQEEAKAAIDELTGESVSDNDAENTDAAYLIYNIGFYVDGKEIEPKDKVKLTVQFLSEEGFAVGDPITIIHFTEEGETETIKGTDVTVDEEGELSTSFETDSFSEFVFTNAAYDGGVSTFGYNARDGIWYINEETQAARVQSFVDALNDTNFNGTIRIQGDFTLNTTNGYNLPILGNGRSVTIDLNGHEVGADGALVQVNTGATLTITDSATPAVTTEVILTDEDSSTDTPSIFDYDKTAVYDAANQILTYYVTETKIIDSATGATQETLVKYTVNAQNMGIITGHNYNVSVINVNGGTLNFEKGMIANSQQRAVHVVNGGTANLKGGYLCGNNTYSGNATTVDGGAVYAHESTINASGTVIAANRANFGGGIHGTVSSTINISDNAVIAGNTARYRGGGVDVWESSVNMMGGYVTNNVANDNSEYYSGGGGILLRGGYDDPTRPKLTISGGRITGNSAYSGGGVYLGPGSTSDLIMTGGFVTANYASTGEGGGIRIDHSCIGRITGGYITNNITMTPGHWGGGGLFIADAATCQVMSVIVTNNDASGFGGGVAGCSTGRIHVSAIDNETKGAAIYLNRAEGENVSGTDSIKQQDHIYAKSNPVFMESGYQDYFCMLYSNITGSMLGDGYENWEGSIDGVAVTIPGDTSKVGNSVVGLTANPTVADISAAQDMAAAQKGVYINGNYSNTHGGGVLCNGYMVMGALEGTPEFFFGTRMELAGVKDYLSAEDNSSIPMEGKEFTFVLREEGTEKEVARAYNDANGELVFDRRLVFGEYLNPVPNETEATTYSYILEEEESGIGIITDKTKYKVDVDVILKREYGYIPTLTAEGNVVEEAIIKSIYHLQEVRIYKGDGTAGNWGEPVLTVTEEEMESKEESQAIIVDLRNSDTLATFINYAMDYTELTVNKEWAPTTPEEEKQEIEVFLYQDDVQYGTSVKLNAGNGWSHTWENLPVIYEDEDPETGNPITRLHTYAVKETTFDGYLAEYTYTSKAESKAYWVPADSLVAGNQYLIVNTEEDIVLNVTSTNWNSDFDSRDQLDITREITDGSVIGAKYADVTCYKADNIPDTAVFLAQKYKERVVLKNAGYYDSWIQVYGANYWGGSTERLVSYASFFEYNVNSNGLLQGREGSEIDGTRRTIRYGYFDGAYQFTVSDSATDTVNAQLYTLERTVSDGATVVTITNTPIEEADFDLEITKYGGYIDENDVLQKKTDANGEGILLAGAEFQIFRSSNLKEPLEFTQLVNGDYQFYEEGGETGSVPLTSVLISGTGGNIKVVGMRTGDYVLKEIVAPIGYEITNESELIAFRLDENTENGIWTCEVINEPTKYILPETGSGGTSMYTMAGLLLICSAVFLMYKKEKRRKEGKTSS